MILLIGLIISMILGMFYGFRVVPKNTEFELRHSFTMFLLMLMPLLIAVQLKLLKESSKEGYDKGYNDGIRVNFKRIIKTDTLYVPKLEITEDNDTSGYNNEF